MPKTPKLADVAAAQADDAKAKKARGMFAALSALLGISAKGADAKTSKHTVTTKRTETTEEDTDAGADAEDSESGAGAEDSESGADAEAEGDDEEKSDAAAEAEGEDSDTGKPAEDAEDKGEDKEAKAIAKAHKGALAAADAAYMAHAHANAPKYAASLALRSPARVERTIRKATGATTFDGAMSALSRKHSYAAEGHAKVIGKIADMEARVVKVEKQSRAQRIDAIVVAAKSDGRASSKDLRAELRGYGMANGSKALAKLVSTLPKVTTSERRPKIDGHGNALGAPSTEEQAHMMEASMTGLDEKGRAEFAALHAETLKKHRALNGTAGGHES